jgi:hypothetical protein
MMHKYNGAPKVILKGNVITKATSMCKTRMAFGAAVLIAAVTAM